MKITRCFVLSRFSNSYKQRKAIKKPSLISIHDFRERNLSLEKKSLGNAKYFKTLISHRSMSKLD